MKLGKHILTTCVLLLIFVCASAAPSLYAQDVPDKQKFGIGLKGIQVSGGTYLGVGARIWTESKLGFDFGWVTDGESASGSGISASARIHAIPASVLYTVTHVDVGSVYIRPYVGGGINISHLSTNLELDLPPGVPPAIADAIKKEFDELTGTKAGGQGFFGAEFTITAVPRLSFLGEVGVHHIHGNRGWAAGFGVKYYLR